MRSVETEGNSIDEAITRALHVLGADRAQVEIEILENARRGMLGIGRRAARVRATMRVPMSWLDSSASDVIPESGGEDHAAPRDGGRPPSAEPAAALLSEILRHMGAVADVVEGVSPNGDRTLVVSGAGANDVIGRHGEVLDALEYLVNRISERTAADAPRFTLDADGYRERRRESLAALAHRVAEKTRRKGKSVTLSPMNPADRRTVHVALQAEPGVSARSVGQGFYRKLMVIPEGARRGGGKPDR